MAEIEKRLGRREWRQLRELLGLGDVGYIRLTASGDWGGRDLAGNYDRVGEHSSIEVAMKEAPPAAEGAKRMPLAFKEAPVRFGNHYFGYALVSRTKGSDGEWEEHVDTDGDSMTDDVLVAAWKRTFGQPTPLFKGHSMDDRVVRGWVSWFPAVEDVMKGLGMSGDKSGLVAAMQVDDAELRKEIDSGRYGSISIEARVRV